MHIFTNLPEHQQSIGTATAPPFKKGYCQRKWVIVNGTNVFPKSYLEGPFSRFLKLFLVEWRFLRKRERAVWGHPLLVGTVHLHEVSGVKITNQSLVIEPLGWKNSESLRGTNQESTSRIQSFFASAKSITPRFNQVLWGGDVEAHSCQG